MRTITFDLSPESVDNAIKKLEQYSNSLMGKVDFFVERLKDIGMQEANNNAHPIGDSADGNLYFKRSNLSQNHAVIDIFFEGKDVLFIEFGAGIHYNGAAGSSPHPMGAELGYTIGSYGEGHGAQDSWRYLDENNNSQISYGTMAGMPMYKAAEEMHKQLTTIAKDIFGT